MNLIVLHATGLAWDEISFLVVPATLIMGLVLFLSSRTAGQEAEEGDNGEIAASEDGVAS